MIKSNVRFCYLKQLDKSFRSINFTKVKAIGAKGKYWQVGDIIDVFFIGGTIPQQNFIKGIISELEKFVNLKFIYTDNAVDSDIRISFVSDNTSWSYEGTDCLKVPKEQATMNFGWLDSRFPSDKGTVRHELLHSIGGVHEHNWGDIDWNLVEIIKDTNWSVSDIENNITNSRNNVDKTGHRDIFSNLHYMFPRTWANNADEIDLPLHSNNDYSETDIEFWKTIYPFDKIPEEEDVTRIYINALNFIYESPRCAKMLPKKVNKKVAEEFGLDSTGLEKEIVERILQFLKRV